MKLSDHFYLAEMVTTQHRWVDNTPTAEIIDNLKLLCTALENIRQVLEHPILVTSGYRCPELNKLVGGSPTSRHKSGLAADFICPGYGSPLEVCKKIVREGIPFDQLIYERTWVHFGVSFAGEKLRGHVFTLSVRGLSLGG